MFKKKLKNPITVIRKPEDINQEYSQKVVDIGRLELELADIRKTETKFENRKNEIAVLKEDILDRIMELSDEMNEAQAELKKNKKPKEESKEATP